MFSLKKYVALFSLLFLISCQSEIDEQETVLQETITPVSHLASYLQRIAMVNTVQDNMIDQSNYCTIQFPYTVKVNNVSIALNSKSDYQKVIDKMNASTTDDDMVKLDFPVTMIYYNYIEKWLPDEKSFNALIDYWNQNPDLLSKINGLNINYPITINTYNSSNQAASSTLIASDQAFYYFIKNLSSSQYISLKYPISTVDYKNQTRTISTNMEFEEAIKYVIDYCPENNIVALDLEAVLTKGSWEIPYYFETSDKTLMFTGYSFVFKNDNTVVATKGGISETGKWKIQSNNNKKELQLDFSSTQLGKLDVSWKLFEFNNSQIRLREVSLNSNYLYFEKK